jgi:hypothetical protein
MMGVLSKLGCRKWLLNRSMPPPRWLGLEPGEAYLGSYPRGGLAWAALLGLVLGIAPALIGAFSLDANWAAYAWAGPVIAVTVALAARFQNRVHVTSQALVLKEHRQYRVIRLAQIDGVSYDGNLDRWRVRLHYTDAGQPGVLELESHCPRQTAEELSQLLAQYGGGEVAVTGGKR